MSGDQLNQADETRRYGRRHTRVNGGWRREPGLWHVMVQSRVGSATVCGGHVYASNPRNEQYAIAAEPPEGKVCAKCTRAIRGEVSS